MITKSTLLGSPVFVRVEGGGRSPEKNRDYLSVNFTLNLNSRGPGAMSLNLRSGIVSHEIARNFAALPRDLRVSEEK